jgi:putative membrane protein
MLTAASTAVSPWRWHAHPTVWLVMVLLAGAYALLITRVGPGQVGAGEVVVTRRQLVFFTVGVAVLWANSDWPIHDLSERYLFSVHMVQHLSFTLIAPPLLLLGLPDWSVRWAVHGGKPNGRALEGLFKKLAKPIPAAVIYNCVFVFTHIPGVVDAALHSELLHFCLHAAIFVTALNMWFPVLNRLPEYPRLGNPARMVYLFLQSIVPTVPAAFLTLGDGVVYRFYASVPRPFPISALDDQQLAGAIMKVYGGLILWGCIVVMFFRWYAQSQAESKPRQGSDVLRWEDVERELERTEAPAATPPPRP